MLFRTGHHNVFAYHLPVKIIFGRPAATALREELELLQARRVLLISDPGLARLGLVEQMQTSLDENNRVIIPFTNISSNPTSDDVATALDMARANQVQTIIALGGGSAIDVSKAVAMLMTNGGSYADYQWKGKDITQPSLPLLAVPTTAGTGSEVSKVAVIIDPEQPFKKGVLSPMMFARAAILDPELTRTLPPTITAATGIDAFTHALEAYIGRRANPYTDMLALTSLEVIWQHLPRAVADGNDMTARSNMLLAATWAGTAMDHAGLGLIHSLSGPITSTLHLHHGLTNGILLPHVLRFNLPSIPYERRQRLKHIVGLNTDAPDDVLVETIAQFVHDLGLPNRLGQVADISRLSDYDPMVEDTIRMAMTPNNPRPVTTTDVTALLNDLLQ